MLVQLPRACSAPNIPKAPKGGLLLSSQVSREQRDAGAELVHPMSRTAAWGRSLHGVGASRKVTALGLATVGLPISGSHAAGPLQTGLCPRRSRKPWAKMRSWYKG